MKEKPFDITKLKKVPKEKCFICKNQIISEDIIYEDDRFIAFLDLYPPTKGYALLAIKKHIEDITELSEEEHLEVQKILLRLSKAIKNAFQPRRIWLLQTGYLVPHFHFHIIPSYDPKANPIDTILKKTILEISKEEREQIIAEIKKNF